jgi:ABC-type glycerol-3-phosphate transport system substrate-binding protein
MVYTSLVGTWMVGPWYVDMAAANAPQQKWSFHKLPCYKTCDNTDQPEFLVMFKGVKDPDLAWAAAELLLKPEYDVDLSLLTGAIPIYKDNVNKGGWATDPVWQKFGQLGIDPELRPRWHVDGYAEVASVITPELQAAQFGEKGVKEALADAEKAANEVLESVRA